MAVRNTGSSLGHWQGARIGAHHGQDVGAPNGMAARTPIGARLGTCPWPMRIGAAIAALLLCLVLLAPQAVWAQTKPTMQLLRANTQVTNASALSMTVRINPGDYAPEQLHLVASVREPVDTVTQATQTMLTNKVGWVFSTSVVPITHQGSGPFEVAFTRTLQDMYLHRWDSQGVYPLHLALVAGNEEVSVLTVLLTVSPQPLQPGQPLTSPDGKTSVTPSAIPSSIIWPLTVSAAPALSNRPPQRLFDEIANRLIPDMKALASVGNQPVTILTDPSLLDDITANATPSDTKSSPAIQSIAQTASEQAQALASNSHIRYVALPYARADMEQLADGGLYQLAAQSLSLSLRTIDNYMNTKTADERILTVPYGYGIASHELTNPQAVLALEPPGLLTGMYAYSSTNNRPVIVPEQDIPRLVGAFGQNAAMVQTWVEAASFIRYSKREPFVIALNPVMDPPLRASVVHQLMHIPWIHVQGFPELVKEAPKTLSMEAHTYVQSVLAVEAQRENKDTYGTLWLLGGRSLDAQTLDSIKQLEDYMPRIASSLGAKNTLLGMTAEQISRSLVRAATTAPDRAPFARDVVTQWEYRMGSVEIVSPPPITLTSSSGTLPVRLGNAGQQPIEVIIKVRSPGLYFPEGQEHKVTVQPGSIAQVPIAIGAKIPGALTPAYVQMLDPVTHRVLQEATVPVRSSAYPVTALVLFVLAILVLAGKMFSRYRAKATQEPGAPLVLSNPEPESL